MNKIRKKRHLNAFFLVSAIFSLEAAVSACAMATVNLFPSPSIVLALYKRNERIGEARTTIRSAYR
jgi:hypothetical protein